MEKVIELYQDEYYLNENTPTIFIRFDYSDNPRVGDYEVPDVAKFEIEYNQDPSKDAPDYIEVIDPVEYLKCGEICVPENMQQVIFNDEVIGFKELIRLCVEHMDD